MELEAETDTRGFAERAREDVYRTMIILGVLWALLRKCGDSCSYRFPRTDLSCALRERRPEGGEAVEE
jgi:hypothetical protein